MLFFCILNIFGKTASFLQKIRQKNSSDIREDETKLENWPKGKVHTVCKTLKSYGDLTQNTNIMKVLEEGVESQKKVWIWKTGC